MRANAKAEEDKLWREGGAPETYPVSSTAPIERKVLVISREKTDLKIITIYRKKKHATVNYSTY